MTRTPEELVADPVVQLMRLQGILQCVICAQDTAVNTDVCFGVQSPGYAMAEALMAAERMVPDIIAAVEADQRKMASRTA